MRDRQKCKNASHTPFMQFSVIMELHENSMTIIFGQPGNIIFINSNQVNLSSFKLTYFNAKTYFHLSSESNSDSN